MEAWQRDQGLVPLAQDRGLAPLAHDKALPPEAADVAAACSVPAAQAVGIPRRETIHRMTRRCRNWDYRARAIYQITLVQADRRTPLLGRLDISDGAGRWKPCPVSTAPAADLAPEAVEARVIPSALGEAILAHWKRIGEFTPEIRPLYCQIMPDHIHAILEVTRPMARPLGNAIGGFKTGCEKLCRQLVPEVPHLFAAGFQDTILFHEGQLDNMFRYLRDNPRRLAVKRLFPELFRLVGNLRVRFQGLAPLAQDRAPLAAGAVAACSVPAAQAVACSVPAAQAVGFFSALGNRFLLDRPLLQVQVSRKDFAYRREPVPGGRGLKISRNAAGEPQVAFSSPAFEEKRDALLAAARHGAVLISPCVSDGERQIAREALAASLPLVTLQNKGFSPFQKPPGRYFDACSDGRLLMLAPAVWPYQPGEKPMTRRDALALNRLCQWLAGNGAADIAYRGVTFADVDAIAFAAVKATTP